MALMEKERRVAQSYVLFIYMCGYVYSDHIRVCPGDDLDINCPIDEVILPKSAKFGRMGYTECTIVKDFIGCENDILYLIDKWCSGQSHCVANVPNKELIQANTACLPYMRKYLELEYSCLKVISASEADCRMNKSPTDREGIISSHVCTSVQSAWIITAMLGQKIQLNIIDFGSEQFKMDNNTDPFPLYGYIQDGSKRVQFNGGLERERPLYDSESNEISLQMLEDSSKFGFLIQYRKIGCPDLSPPAHAWYKRDGDQAVIGCEWSQKTWHLSCDGRSWSGVVGNCSVTVTRQPPNEEIDTSNPSVLWLVCLASVCLVVVVVVCVIGVVCIRKHRIKQDVQKTMTLQRVPGQGHYDLDPNIEMASMLYLPYKLCEEQQPQQGTLSDPHRPTSYLIPQDEVVNELTPIRIWERPLPDLPDKPLTSGTAATHTAVRSGRTPGDGDEAVGISNVPESTTTTQSRGDDLNDKPVQIGHKYLSQQ
ncbi:hypothetical protein LSH36_2132g00023 [Paralvinella palmiformis]|uniref:SUEL-type lectin domain-containing protein n=1 Tax=Paralvinella palmiformis TaxID=53620 RepID=A0AAD9MQA5_9ANNE|nr:hypothetical protein LSH36_2132g00023 [Paralvinella palmiformis]